jgi:hypothetical protein
LAAIYLTVVAVAAYVGLVVLGGHLGSFFASLLLSVVLADLTQFFDDWGDGISPVSVSI